MDHNRLITQPVISDNATGYHEMKTMKMVEDDDAFLFWQPGHSKSKGSQRAAWKTAGDRKVNLTAGDRKVSLPGCRPGLRSCTNSGTVVSEGV